MHRRGFLRASVTVSVAAIAGCSSPGEDEDEDTETGGAYGDFDGRQSVAP